MYSASDLVSMGYGGYAGWGDPAAGYDFLATGGQGKQTSGGTNQTGSSGAGPQTFFTAAEREQAEKDALEKLRPYYEELLKESRGDVTLAKKRLQEDYDLGKRYREEDLGVSKEEWARLEPREKEALLTDLNRRGVFVTQDNSSTIQTAEEKNLGTTQRLRREAITRALDRKGEQAGITQNRNVFDINQTQTRYERDLEQQKRKEAFGIADIAESKRGQRGIAEISRFLYGEPFSRV